MSPTPRPLKVKLISGPQHPLGTLFYVWEQSRTNNPVPSPEMIERILVSDLDVVYCLDDPDMAYALQCL